MTIGSVASDAAMLGFSRRGGAQAGTHVSITAPNETALQSFTTAPEPPDVRVAFARLFGSTAANTGIGFFFANSVGFDVSTGQVVITPQ